MDDLAKKISDLLSSPDAMAQLQNALGTLTSTTNNDQQSSSSPGGPDLEMIMKVKQAYDTMSDSADDPKVNLLIALKPYMGQKRLEHIDTAIKFARLTRLSTLFEKLL